MPNGNGSAISIPIGLGRKQKVKSQMAGGWQIPNKHGYSYIL